MHLHPYAYARDNPLNITEPSGQAPPDELADETIDGVSQQGDTIKASEADDQWRCPADVCGVDAGLTIEQLSEKYLGETLPAVVGKSPSDSESGSTNTCDTGCQLAQGVLWHLGFSGGPLRPEYNTGPRPTTQLDLLGGGYLVGTLSLLTAGILAIPAGVTLEIGSVSIPGVAEGTTGGVAAATGRLSGVLSAISRQYALAQPTTLGGAFAVVQQATASLGLSAGVATSFSDSMIVLQNVGGVVTTLTATGGITVVNAAGTVILQLGR
jgi:hypothetical protein